MKKLPGLLFVFVVSSFADSPLLPAINPAETILSHSAYTIAFDTHRGIAKWSAYMLTREMTHHKKATRSNDFRVDPLAGPASPEPCTYSHSGYDRGHLVPAADMAFSVDAMSESFYMTNMTPQEPSFNRGIWKHLEDQVRKWADKYDTLYIVSGPVPDTGLQKLPPCGNGPSVPIPYTFFKAILSNRHGHEKAIGFLIPNEGTKKPLEAFAVSVGWIEYQTGIDFFHDLPDSLEKAIETSIGPGWDFSERKAKHETE